MMLSLSIERFLAPGGVYAVLSAFPYGVIMLEGFCVGIGCVVYQSAKSFCLCVHPLIATL